MNKKIESHVNELFSGIPKEQKVLEIKEELLSNLTDKYNDLIADGKSEEEAYSLVISSIGDIHGLLGDVIHSGQYTYLDMEKKRNIKSVFVSVGVSLYVLSMAVFFITGEILGMNDLATALTFVFWAAATGLIVYGVNMGKTKYKGIDESFVEKYKEKVSEDDRISKMKRAMSTSLWSSIVVIYFAASFITFAWYCTWIIFLVGVFLQQLILYFLTEPGKRKFLWDGMVWSITLVVYFVISFTFMCWAWSWIIFLVGVAVQQIIRLLILWRNED